MDTFVARIAVVCFGTLMPCLRHYCRRATITVTLAFAFHLTYAQVKQRLRTPGSLLRRKAQALLDRLNAVVPSEKLEAFQGELLGTPFQPAHVARNHTHGACADNRSRSVTFITNTLRAYGYCYHDYQTNRSGAEKTGEYYTATREYYWAKDTDKRHRVDDIPRDAFVVMIDVDQYVDLSVFEGRPMVIFTFRPLAGAGTHAEYSYSVEPSKNGPFGQEDLFTVRVRGQATYKHGIWNHDQDMVNVINYGPFGLPSAITTYSVKIRDTHDPNWSIIYYKPISRYGAIGAWLFLATEIGLNIPTRLNSIAQRGPYPVSVIRRSLDGHDMVSMAVADGIATTHYPVRPDQYDAVRTYTASSKSPTAHGIQSRLNNPQTAMYDILEHPLPAPAYQSHIVAQGYPVIQYRVPSDEPATTTHEQIMPPFVLNGTWIPQRSRQNMIEAAQKRVIDARSDVAMDTQISTWIMQLLDGPLAHFKHTLAPVSSEEVAKRQSSARQQRNLKAALDLLPANECVEAFLKAETYGEHKAPRCITIVNHQHKLEWSMVQYAVAEWLKTFDWYAFGKTPREIARLVMDVCISAEHGVNEADSSKHDGHVSQLLRAEEHRLLLHLFHPEYHAYIVENWRKSFGLFAHAYPKYGDPIKYETGFSRWSGSPETSNKNSINTRLAVYISWRIAGLGVYEAWDKKCIVGGDDLHAADATDRNLKQAYTRLGLEIKTNWVEKGNLGVNFLARFYGPDVWSTDPSSICDIARSLSKMHVTQKMPVSNPATQESRALEKAVAYLLTDKHTPFVGQLARAFAARHMRIRFTRSIPGNVAHAYNAWNDADRVDPCTLATPDHESWWAHNYSREEQWPQEHAVPWAASYLSFWGLTTHLNTRANIDDICKTIMANVNWDLLAYEPIFIFPISTNTMTLARVGNDELLINPSGRTLPTDAHLVDDQVADVQAKVRQCKRDPQFEKGATPNRRERRSGGETNGQVRPTRGGGVTPHGAGKKPPAPPKAPVPTTDKIVPSTGPATSTTISTGFTPATMASPVKKAPPSAAKPKARLRDPALKSGSPPARKVNKGPAKAPAATPGTPTGPAVAAKPGGGHPRRPPPQTPKSGTLPGNATSEKADRVAGASGTPPRVTG